MSDQVLACLLEFTLPEVFFKSPSPVVHGDQAAIHPKIHFAFDLTEAEENVKTWKTSCMAFFDDWPLLPLWWSRQAFAELLGYYRSQTTTLQRRIISLFGFLSLSREVNYLASFITVGFIFTDSPNLKLNPNSKHPNTCANIQYCLIVNGESQGIILSTSEKQIQGILSWLLPNQ